jgi:opine dehydrogenase
MFDPALPIGVLGAGSVGLAVAGHLSLAGHRVLLWNRSQDRIEAIKESGGIRLSKGTQSHLVSVAIVQDVSRVMETCSIIVIATTADAHRSVAQMVADQVRPNHCLFLVPGRTGGALEVGTVLENRQSQIGAVVAEASSSFFASRSEGAHVTIFAEKARVSAAVYPGCKRTKVEKTLQRLFPSLSFRSSVLETAFDNLGAMFHPLVTLVNAAAIEREERFFFYTGVTERQGRMIERLDSERIRAAAAYGVDAMPARDWVKASYPEAAGTTLAEQMRMCRAYTEIFAPKSLESRYLLEGVAVGLVPLFHLGRARGAAMDFTRAVVDFCCVMMDIDFWTEGRGLGDMGLHGLSEEEVIRRLHHGGQ